MSYRLQFARRVHAGRHRGTGRHRPGERAVVHYRTGYIASQRPVAPRARGVLIGLLVGALLISGWFTVNGAVAVAAMIS